MLSGSWRRALTIKRSAIAVALVVAPCCSNVEFVDRITIVNDTDYSANVAVRGGEGSGWVPLTTTPPHSQGNVDEVVDQGDVWVFRLGYGGETEQELRLRREELERSGWRVEVPQSFEEALQERGVPPTSQ